MIRSTRFALTALAFFGVTALGITGCSGRDCFSSLSAAPPREEAAKDVASGGSSSSGGYSVGAPAPASAEAANRAISEANIVQLDDEQDRIYAMSRVGSLAVVDASRPGALSLMGKTALPGEPFEMYRRGDVLLTMSNNALKGDGNIQVTLSEDAAPNPPDATAGAIISAIDVSVPSSMRTLATFKVPGEIADSRIVGNILYLATYENAACWSCGTKPRTMVTTFDVSTPTAPRQVDQISFEGGPAGSTALAAWPTPWKRSIIATSSRLYVGGLAADARTTTDEGVIEVIDISDPAGHLTRGTSITTAGPVMSRWQMDESQGVLRIVTQRGSARTQTGEQYPDVDLYRVESSSSLVRVGHTTMRLPRQEGLKTVRFDGPRAYAITFAQTDPLFTFDLSDPAHPMQKGELTIPGWIFHLEPRGNQLLGLGLDRTNPNGNLNVSLFDVADLSFPILVKRVDFGPTAYNDVQITSTVMAEDQDRIQKAFRIFSDGLIAVPFSGASGSCATQASGIQLIDWTPTSLTKRALLPISGNPRRAVRRDSSIMRELIAISDSNVRSFAIDQRDTVQQTADVVIGKCVNRSVPNAVPMGMPGGPMGNDFNRGYDRTYTSGGSGSCF